MNEITYHREGDYLIPDLLPPEAPRIGVWGQRRKRFLQQYHSGLYTGMLLSDKLNAHLEEIDRQAEEIITPVNWWFAQTLQGSLLAGSQGGTEHNDCIDSAAACRQVS